MYYSYLQGGKIFWIWKQPFSPCRLRYLSNTRRRIAQGRNILRIRLTDETETYLGCFATSGFSSVPWVALLVRTYVSADGGEWFAMLLVEKQSKQSCLFHDLLNHALLWAVSWWKSSSCQRQRCPWKRMLSVSSAAHGSTAKLCSWERSLKFEADYVRDFSSYALPYGINIHIHCADIRL